MSRQPPRDGRRRSRAWRVARALLLVAAGGLLFVVGVAFGRATLDRPQPGERTEVRTLRPGTVAPPARTVTVTVTTEG